MDKKSYLIIGVTILIFLIVIITIIFSNNSKNNNWTTEIKKSQNFQITMTDCNEREKKLSNNILNELSNKWNSLSNNGPWTGDTNTCYNTVTISYDNNGIIKHKQILIIDNSSIVLSIDESNTYYTNANDIINELNKLFVSQ